MAKGRIGLSLDEERLLRLSGLAVLQELPRTTIIEMLIDEAWAKVPEADRERIKAIGPQWERISRMSRSILVAREIARQGGPGKPEFGWYVEKAQKREAIDELLAEPGEATPEELRDFLLSAAKEQSASPDVQTGGEHVSRVERERAQRAIYEYDQRLAAREQEAEGAPPARARIRDGVPPKRRKSKTAKAESVEKRCECDHVRSSHLNDRGRCLFVDPGLNSHRTCYCKRFTACGASL